MAEQRPLRTEQQLNHLLPAPPSSPDQLLLLPISLTPPKPCCSRQLCGMAGTSLAHSCPTEQWGQFGVLTHSRTMCESWSPSPWSSSPWQVGAPLLLTALLAPHGWAVSPLGQAWCH